MRLPQELWNVKKEEINYRMEIYIYLYDYKHTCYVCVCVYTYIHIYVYSRSAKVCKTSEIYAHAIKVLFNINL